MIRLRFLVLTLHSSQIYLYSTLDMRKQMIVNARVYLEARFVDDVVLASLA